MNSKIIFVWRKFAGSRWINAHEATVRSRAGNDLVIVTRPGGKQRLLEIACKSHKQACNLANEFGGRIEQLPRDWLGRFTCEQKSKPVRIGKRLVIVHSPGEPEANNFLHSLIVTAGAAFGTGEHTTTAMSLRLFEKATRKVKPTFVVDLGTGSGILALAATCFGASRVLAIDNDPIAISVAKENARLNKITNIDFKIGDVRRWKFPRRSRPRQSGDGAQADIITANLSRDVLIEILPKMTRTRLLILSGVLRDQEREFVRAVQKNKIDIIEVRRRGKWMAILAKN